MCMNSTGIDMEEHVEAAIEAFRNGNPVCLFDAENREGETDLLFPGQFAEPATMRQLRFDCGGLLFLAIGHEVGERFSLPYLQDLHMDERLMSDHPVLRELQTDDLQYDTRSAFTLSLNHRDTFTGITDRDRALTIKEMSELYNFDDPKSKFLSSFKTPGHVPILIASQGLLTRRKGHTEMSIYLAQLAKLSPITAICEMMDAQTYSALSVEKAEQYAKDNAIPFINGKELLEFAKVH